MNKIALITGASGGIGSAVAKCFADAGYTLALQYRSNTDSIRHLSASLPEQTTYLLLPCDLNDPKAVDMMIASIHEQLGKVSAIVNCAGTAIQQMLFCDTSDSDYEKIMETNVHAPIRLTRLLYDDLRDKHGSVVNISSMWGVTGASCEVLYSASKAALIGFTKALAKELAPSDVTVNAVAPGLIPTQMNAHLTASDLESFRQETPLGRLGTPEDVASAVLFLAEARFITGQVLCCDGGITI